MNKSDNSQKDEIKIPKEALDDPAAKAAIEANSKSTTDNPQSSSSTVSSLHTSPEEILKMAQKILTETYTKPQLLRRLRVLKDFINFRLFKLNPEEFKLNLDKQIQYFLALHQHDILELNLLRQEGSWLISLGDAFYSKFNKDNVNLLFDSIEKQATVSKHIIVYLPVELPEVNQLQIGQWFKDNIGVDTTFETNFDANLIGGCAISYNGVYRDYSLRARIDANKQNILDSLKSFKKG